MTKSHANPDHQPVYRITGPYEHRPGEWRCRIVSKGTREWGPIADSPQRAKRLAESSVARSLHLQPLTVGSMLERYREYMAVTKGNKPRSVTTTLYRLRGFFNNQDLPVTHLTSRLCASRYEELTTAQKADTHRNALAEARTFCRWMVKTKVLKLDPTEGIDPVGRRHRGKPQLHINEARCWLNAAETMARAGEDGAVAAMVTLLMGLRAGEVVGVAVRDLDDGGRMLWIPDSKTAAGRRRVEVPDCLQPYLLELKRDKLPMAPLFGQHWRDWPRRWVQKICKKAGVMRVTAHSMRGLFATLGLQAGAAPHAVAAALGHESPRITLESYAQRGSADIAPARRAVSALRPDQS